MNTEDLEKKILEIVKEKYELTGGHNGNAFGDFDHILKMERSERNTFLQRMADEKKIRIFNGPNYRMISLPK
jgi:hypothetical protein